MKKQLLIAAVAASMTSVAMADISISGSAKVNNNESGTSMETDLTVTGKSGGTSVTAKVSLDGTLAVEQLYANSSVAGVGIKAGTWKGGKSELTQAGGNADHRVNVSTSFGGVKLSWEDKDGSDAASTISGTVGGIKISHKSKGVSSETKASGSVGGISAKMHQKDNGTDTNTAVTLSTSVQGVSLTYVDVNAEYIGGTSMYGFFGKHYGVATANGLGVSTSIAGNKVTYKDMDMAYYGDSEFNTKKLIITRKLASGATFEATYVNSATNILDLELAVKF